MKTVTGGALIEAQSPREDELENLVAIDAVREGTGLGVGRDLIEARAGQHDGATAGCDRRDFDGGY
jgi:hypothetical protein